MNSMPDSFRSSAQREEHRLPAYRSGHDADPAVDRHACFLQRLTAHHLRRLRADVAYLEVR